MRINEKEHSHHQVVIDVCDDPEITMSHAERADTPSLVGELCGRDGVESYAVAPYEDFELTVSGPARVLVVMD